MNKKKELHFCSSFFTCSGVPTGIRTPVAAVKGQCPRPLDDGDAVNFHLNKTPFGGASRDRTGDLLHAMQALSQLSYSPLKVERILRRKSLAVKHHL